MTKIEFRNEYSRLANGHRKSLLVTDERLQAIYESVSHYDLHVFIAAVEQCLRDLSMPTHSRLLAACDWAQGLFDARRRQANDAAAKRVMSSDGFFPEIASPFITLDQQRGIKALRALYFRSFALGISPLDTIPLVEELAKTWPFLAEEVPALQLMAATSGNRWTNASGEIGGVRGGSHER